MTYPVFAQTDSFKGELVNQSNTRHLSFVGTIDRRFDTELTQTFGQDLPALIVEAIAAVHQCYQQEVNYYNIIIANDKTTELAQLDTERDNLVYGSKSMAESLVRLGTVTQKTDAQLFLDQMRHYAIDPSERYADETTNLDHFIASISGAAWQQKVSNLGLTDTIARLTTINQRMDELITERNNDLAEIPRSAMETARAASEEALRYAFQVLNALAVTNYAEGSSPYDTCIARINQDIDYFKRNVFNLRKSKDTTPQPEPEPEPDDQGGDDDGGEVTPVTPENNNNNQNS